MQDLISCAGHLKIELLDKDKNVVDCFDDNNMIMLDARTTMAEIFASKGTSTFINRLSLGTLGHTGADLLAPKTDIEGFVNTKTRMFSEALPVVLNEAVTLLHKNDLLIVGGTYHQYIGITSTGVTITSAILADNTQFVTIATQPYTYDLNFTIPTSYVDLVNGDNVTVVETDLDAGSTMSVLQSGTSLTFNAEIAPSAANSQDVISSVFTEAALYANGRIFSLKTFKAKIKDTTVSIRITWKITF